MTNTTITYVVAGGCGFLGLIAFVMLLVIPAVVWDRDGRGLHDRWAGTVEVRR